MRPHRHREAQRSPQSRGQTTAWRNTLDWIFRSTVSDLGTRARGEVPWCDGLSEPGIWLPKLYYDGQCGERSSIRDVLHQKGSTLPSRANKARVHALHNSQCEYPGSQARTPRTCGVQRRSGAFGGVHPTGGCSVIRPAARARDPRRYPSLTEQALKRWPESNGGR